VPGDAPNEITSTVANANLVALGAVAGFDGMIVTNRSQLGGPTDKRTSKSLGFIITHADQCSEIIEIADCVEAVIPAMYMIGGDQ